ncbi:hypothetical protein LGV61_00320 [Desulfurispirillum indicum]|uniref:Lipoprotein n=1 Tax=Desulfurispirillum indicum (strain ATCC BAA-1389 / DSM 22839 / S5) TaxID=653733 RepID=E6W4U3_DESIS|nr:hypothetical protein [Desulfurispirillum indicum]ADU64821.1 hypothetical protein Selin_0062 [Desulfurispirillum indicum S5]UCZ56755.1 hypothetical protein LGV61_00320 [Desulfurispirillum indicum]
MYRTVSSTAMCVLLIMVALLLSACVAPGQQRSAGFSEEPLPDWIFFTSSSYGLEYASECVPIEASEDVAREQAIALAHDELSRRQGRILPPHLRDNPTFEIVETRRVLFSGTPYICVLMRIHGGR